MLNFRIDKELNNKGSHSILNSTVLRDREPHVASETFDHILAGQETAGITLTYLCWHLSKQPNLQKELGTELSAVFSDSVPQEASSAAAADIRHQDFLPDPKRLDGLPLLHAVIQETLRLHAPIPGPQPRTTPYPSCTLSGFQVPGGVRVAAMAYTLHRDENVFSEPEKWDHRRWLDSNATAEDIKMRHRQSWAFGSGGRMCIGSNFSIIDDTGIEPTDRYTSRPESESLTLRFDPIRVD